MIFGKDAEFHSNKIVKGKFFAYFSIPLSLNILIQEFASSARILML